MKKIIKNGDLSAKNFILKRKESIILKNKHRITMKKLFLKPTKKELSTKDIQNVVKSC